MSAAPVPLALLVAVRPGLDHLPDASTIARARVELGQVVAELDPDTEGSGLLVDGAWCAAPGLSELIEAALRLAGLGCAVGLDEGTVLPASPAPPAGRPMLLAASLARAGRAGEVLIPARLRGALDLPAGVGAHDGPEGLVHGVARVLVLRDYRQG